MQGTQRARFVEQLLSRAPDYASFVLVILAGFLLARLAWMLFPAAPRPLLTSNDSGVVNSATQAQPNLGDTLAGYHLFGVYQADSGKPAPTNIQNTQLALKLQGVYAPPNDSGYAVIEENAQQKIYAAGSTIGNSGAVLEQILGDHVLLRRNGLLEKLPLPKAELSGGSNAAAAGFADNAPMDMPPTDYTQPPPEMMPPPEMFTPSEGAVPPPLPEEAPQPEPVAAEPQANLGEFRQSVMNNNMRLLEVASPQPYERDGKFLGFQLSPGSNVAMFNQLGLQPGDIVTAVNGTVLENPAIAMRLLQEAATASQVNLNITRNGQEVSLPINFQ
ncbi:PDZ domain-containing protein [Thiothrix subterranea]|uniref:type II secretion system protein N n=1 Tax=Thiothrix subterranea TaxID=2735563 RepID=UPI00192A7058|nr:type II secretion system protein N [Thiothrix subterranea]QQZ28881.1 PDZ domain-containing protein [Thiothrix subterranea]